LKQGEVVLDLIVGHQGPRNAVGYEQLLAAQLGNDVVLNHHGCIGEYHRRITAPLSAFTSHCHAVDLIMKSRVNDRYRVVGMGALETSG
jgi:hypothetical protein